MQQQQQQTGLNGDGIDFMLVPVEFNINNCYYLFFNYPKKSEFFYVFSMVRDACFIRFSRFISYYRVQVIGLSTSIRLKGISCSEVMT
jgi:hypothetical protein